MVDPQGVYVRPEGDVFITGGPATPTGDPDPFALPVDYDQFDELIWPTLAHRIPAFGRIKMTRAWAGHYEVNTFDHNALIGWGPGMEGLMLAVGFSGHGMQHSPAAGRGVAELITSGGFTTLDLSSFSPERLTANRPLVELNIDGRQTFIEFPASVAAFVGGWRWWGSGTRQLPPSLKPETQRIRRICSH